MNPPIIPEEPIEVTLALSYAKHVKCIDNLTVALTGLLRHYTCMINSGDYGNWNPEEEPVVIAARKALKDNHD